MEDSPLPPECSLALSTKLFTHLQLDLMESEVHVPQVSTSRSYHKARNRVEPTRAHQREPLVMGEQACQTRWGGSIQAAWPRLHTQLGEPIFSTLIRFKSWRQVKNLVLKASEATKQCLPPRPPHPKPHTSASLEKNFPRTQGMN